MSDGSQALAPEFWSEDPEHMLDALAVSADGLTSADARERLARYGPNRLRATDRKGPLRLLLSQFTSPIILILLAAAALSVFLGDRTDAIIIFAIVAASGALSFAQEYRAAGAVAGLLAVVEVKAQVLRDGRPMGVSHDQVVPGDVLLLSAGSTVPADALLIDGNALFVDEATLTGETFPAEKQPGVLPADTPLARRSNSVFMGTHVVSGTGLAIVVRTGAATEFGAVAEHLAAGPSETDFEHGVRRFGSLLMEITLLLVIAIFAANVLLHKPVIDSFLFSLALAVGLTPQLLPAIISINLSRGARRMAERRVIVKRLDSIEDFGSMDILCSDKTGTLTTGTVRVHGAFDTSGDESDDVLLYAYLNSYFETSFANPIDDAIRTARPFDVSRVRKLDEEPYDFVRKRLSILVERDGKPFMVTKGSVSSVLSVCDRARTHRGATVRLDEVRPEIERLYKTLSDQGYRTLGLAVRDDLSLQRIDPSHESGMTLVGIIALFDPPKPDAAAEVARLRDLGVTLKLVTGDNAPVARTLGAQMGLEEPVVLTGPELAAMSVHALTGRVSGVDIFAEIEPNQKEAIVHALREAGHVVGYLGDGINDASALHEADVGISVGSAVDVARDAADIVLLDPGLDVLSRGVADGRATFANTLKYVFMATSANFGNMFSMAGASLFLKFLPFLPKQVLLINLITDLPEMNIATDNVDPELVERPRRWDIRFIRDFMLTFGLLSSVFDYLTFGALLLLMRIDTATAYGQSLFQTGWFVESVLSASMVVLIIRTRRPVWRSRPGKGLAIATVAVWIATLALPYMPFAALFHFVPLPWPFLALLAAILALYMTSAELAKHVFYRRHADLPARRVVHRPARLGR